VGCQNKQRVWWDFDRDVPDGVVDFNGIRRRQVLAYKTGQLCHWETVAAKGPLEHGIAQHIPPVLGIVQAMGLHTIVEQSWSPSAPPSKQQS